MPKRSQSPLYRIRWTQRTRVVYWAHDQSWEANSAKSQIYTSMELAERALTKISGRGFVPKEEVEIEEI